MLRLFFCMLLMLVVMVTRAAFISSGAPPSALSAVPGPPDTTAEKSLMIFPGGFFVTPHKFSLKQKVVLQLVKWKLNKFVRKNGEATPRQKRLGKLSLIFGIAAFAVVIIPVVNILSVPAAITAIILGIISLKGNTNTNGIIGLSLGGLFFFLIFLLVALLILAFSNW